MSKIIIHKGDKLHIKGRPCVVSGFQMGDFIGDPWPIKVTFIDGKEPICDAGLLPGAFDEFKGKDNEHK